MTLGIGGSGVDEHPVVSVETHPEIGMPARRWRDQEVADQVCSLMAKPAHNCCWEEPPVFVMLSYGRCRRRGQHFA